MPKQFTRAALVAALLAVAASPARAQRGALTRPLTLAEMVDQAEVVVRGRIIAAGAEPHPDDSRLQTVVVTLRVAETLKGHSGESFTFRFFIWDVRDRSNAAGYRKGQEVLLLLSPATRRGLRSTAGLEQGRFRIVRDATGAAAAVNGHGNAGLFGGLEAELKRRGLAVSVEAARLAAERPAGPVPLTQLTELIRSLARGGR